MICSIVRVFSCDSTSSTSSILRCSSTASTGQRRYKNRMSKKDDLYINFVRFSANDRVYLLQDIITDSGLKIEVLSSGVECVRRVSAGDKITAHYSGSLLNGKDFDSSLGGDPIEVVIGKHFKQKETVIFHCRTVFI